MYSFVLHVLQYSCIGHLSCYWDKILKGGEAYLAPGSWFHNFNPWRVGSKAGLDWWRKAAHLVAATNQKEEYGAWDKNTSSRVRPLWLTSSNQTPLPDSTFSYELISGPIHRWRQHPMIQSPPKTPSRKHMLLLEDLLDLKCEDACWQNLRLSDSFILFCGLRVGRDAWILFFLFIFILECY